MPYKLRRIEASPRTGKKWRATFYDKDADREKHTDFGATGYDDFTTSGDEEQKKRYQTRHAKDLKTGDPTKAGFLSYYILWNKPTITGSVRDYKSRFNM
jgi:hypothetical protein